MPLVNNESLLADEDRYFPFNEGGTFEPDSSMPEELQTFFEANNVNKKFTVTLFKFSSEAGVGRPSTLISVKDSIPKEESIASIWGPGNYKFKFFYNPNSKSKKHTIKEHDFCLEGAYYEDLYEKGQDMIQEKREERLEKKYKEEGIKRRHLGVMELHKPEPQVDPLQAGRIYMKDMLDLKRADGGGGDNQMMIMMMNQGQESSRQMTQMMMTMMVEMNKSSTSLITAILGSQGNNKIDPMGIYDSAMERVAKMIEVRQSLTPQQETNVDKIVNMMTGIGKFVIMGMMNKPLEERQNSEVVQGLKKDPMFEELVKSPEMQASMIERLDKDFKKPGDVDKIISTFGFTRPGQVPETEPEVVIPQPEPPDEGDMAE